MKAISPEGLAALENGCVVAGAVYIACAPEPVAAWGGYGDQIIDGVVFKGVGDRAMAQVSGGALGGTEQNVTLTLNGLDTEVMKLLDAGSLRDSAAVVWRLIFDASGTILHDALVFTRGRLDTLPLAATAGGEFSITALIEGAARGQGRAGARTRSDADQRLIDPTDAGMSVVSYAGQKTLYTGGRPPFTAAAAVAPSPAQQTLDNIFS